MVAFQKDHAYSLLVASKSILELNSHSRLGLSQGILVILKSDHIHLKGK